MRKYVKMQAFLHVGEVREWPIRTVSKTVVPKGTVGSNPTLSATTSLAHQLRVEHEISPTRYKKEGGIRTEVLKGILPLHGVTGAMRRHEGAGPLVGVRD